MSGKDIWDTFIIVITVGNVIISAMNNNWIAVLAWVTAFFYKLQLVGYERGWDEC
jgi:hypothetical protein